MGEEKSNYMANTIKDLEMQNKELIKKVKSLELALKQQSITRARNSLTLQTRPSESKRQLNTYQGLIRKQLADLGIEKPAESVSHHRPTKSYGGNPESIRQPSPSGQPPIIPVKREDLEVEDSITATDKKSLNMKYNLKSHLDSIRSLYFMDERKLLSASEDGTVKLWDIT